MKNATTIKLKAVMRDVMMLRLQLTKIESDIEAALVSDKKKNEPKPKLTMITKQGPISTKKKQ